MSRKITRVQLYERVWAHPLVSVAPEFGITDVALKKTCAKFDIPVPERGYWAKLQANKPTIKAKLPPRPPGMDDEVVVGGRNHYWYDRLSNQEILGPIPNPPSFPEELDVVRERVRKLIGKVSVPKVVSAQHPVIARLTAKDEERRQKQLASTYSFSWDKPIFDSPFEQRRLRCLNSLFLAVARCNGKPELGGREAREVSIRFYQTSVALTLDVLPVGRSKASAAQNKTGQDKLHLLILGGHNRVPLGSWRDGEEGRIESAMTEIAVEVVVAAEIRHRESCLQSYQWRVERKAELEEEARQRQLELERKERERQLRLEKERIDRLLDEADSLRRAGDIRAYVEAVKTLAELGPGAESREALERWAQWALAEADRIDPVKNGRFLKGFDGNSSDE